MIKKTSSIKLIIGVVSVIVVATVATKEIIKENQSYSSIISEYKKLDNKSFLSGLRIIDILKSEYMKDSPYAAMVLLEDSSKYFVSINHDELDPGENLDENLHIDQTFLLKAPQSDKIFIVNKEDTTIYFLWYE